MRSRANSIRRALTIVAVGGLLSSVLVAGASSSGVVNAADEPLFDDVSEAFVDDEYRRADVDDSNEPNVRPDDYRSVRLNRAPMTERLGGLADGETATIELPAPDGTTQEFEVGPNATMSPELAAKYPQIRTYSGRGITDRTSSIALDLTQHGFHAQVLSPAGRWYIDPAMRFADSLHVSYERGDLPEPDDAWQEFDLPENSKNQAPDVERRGGLANNGGYRGDGVERPSPNVAQRSGSQLETHRIVVTADQAYSEFHSDAGDSDAVRIADVQAEIVTAINRVSAIYQQEVAVRFQLVGNADDLIYLRGPVCTNSAPLDVVNIVESGPEGVFLTTTTPHGLSVGDTIQISGTSNSQYDGFVGIFSVESSTTVDLNFAQGRGDSVGGTIIETGELDFTAPSCSPFTNTTSDIDLNQIVTDAVIGDANYDVGHLSTRTSGGVAGLGVVGVSGQKARGVTGLGSPTSDPYYIDFLAHELGHQYGGRHSFNGALGSCSGGNRSQQTAYEPGSGSTIQAYASICGRDDLQRAGNAVGSTGASDPYFHSISFDEITAHLADESDALPAGVASGNTVPNVSAGSDIAIPAQTPFYLNAAASDPDGDTLMTHFEQRDVGDEQRRLTNPQVTAGPLFRSFPPTAESRSTFPRLSDVVADNTNQRSSCPTISGAFDLDRANCWAQYLIQADSGTSRALNFRAIVRDGAGTGNSAGGVATDDVRVAVNNTGTPFRVRSPNGGEAVARSMPVTWDVAETSGAPISAADVGIRLSTDGGVTFDRILLASTPNDGNATVVLPNERITDAMIMVHSGDWETGGGFFDISDATFDIGPSGVVGVTVEQADSQDDPTDDTSIQFTVRFTETVTGFDAADVIIDGTAGATTATVSGSGTEYTVSITGMNQAGTVRASVRADAADGGSVASISNDGTVTWSDVPIVAGPDIVSIEPFRVLETRTRPGEGTGDTQFELGRRLVGGETLALDVIGRSTVPFNGVTAVVLNATIVGPSGSGFVTLFPCGPGGPPNASSLNARFGGGGAVANEVIVKLGVNDQVCIFTSGETDFVVDMVGWVATTSSLTSLTPFRVLETRSGPQQGTGDDDFEIKRRLNAGETFRLDVLNRGGVPERDVGAVVLNTTMVGAVGSGFVTVFPCNASGTPPNASSLNAPRGGGGAIANEVVAKLGTNDQVCFFANVSTHLVVDVTGWLPPVSGLSSLTPSRVLETRSGSQQGTGDDDFEIKRRLNAGETFELTVLNRGGVPASGVSAVVLNTTMVGASGSGFVTVFPCRGGLPPRASSLNAPLGGGGAVPNEVIAKLGTGGKVCFFTSVETDLVVDVTGWLAS